jgi:hypothetical protein
MAYKPIIRYTVNDHPYIQIDLGDLPPKQQDKLVEVVGEMIESFHVSHQRTTDWLKHADEVNENWRRQKEDLGCLLSNGVVLK